MVLVDTSIWIRFLRNLAPYAAEMDRLIENSEVAGHDLVYGELLIGDCGGRSQFLHSYDFLRHAPTMAHPEVAAFVRSHKLSGKGIGWVDAHLLASALVGGATLWTADEHLSRLAVKFGIAY